MARTVTMGKIMLRLSTPDNEKLIQADKSDINYGSGEANAAVSLVNYGHEAEFITVVPADPIGECIVAVLRKYNVGTKHITRSGERPDIYFLEIGSATRASNAVYDRVHSSVSTATAGQFNFDETSADADWFHFTGITPAVSDAAIELTEAALKAARAHNVAVSVDLNFRKKLQSSEKAQKVITNLMQYVDVCIGDEKDAEKVLGLKPGNIDTTSGELELVGYIDIFSQMADRFGFKYIIGSLRESYSAPGNGWPACIMDGKTCGFYHSRKYHITPIIDRVGGGDSFAAGLIRGLVDGGNMKAALEYAVAASALKHTIPDDFSLVTRTDVESLTGGDGSGRVQR